MSLQEQIKSEIKEAMKNKDQIKLSVVRGLVSAFTNELVAKGKMPTDSLSDEEALVVIKRATKQRKDAIEQFINGGRPELAESEQAELTILETYLPAQASSEQIKNVAEAKIKELDINDKSKAGQLVGIVMKELNGQADGNEVKKIIDELLS